MIKNKSDSMKKARRSALYRFLKITEPSITPGLFCYVCLMLKRSDLFAENSPHEFRWRAFRGINISIDDYRRTEEFLDRFKLRGDYPDMPVVCKNLKNRAYMKTVAQRIETRILSSETTEADDWNSVNLMMRGIKLNDRFRRLVERSPILRLRDIERRLHVERKIAEALVHSALTVGRVRIIHHMTGPDWIIRNGRWAR